MKSYALAGVVSLVLSALLLTGCGTASKTVGPSSQYTTVTGRVVSAGTGNPNGAGIIVRLEQDYPDAGGLTPPSINEATTDDEGNFVMYGVVLGAHTVTAYRDTYEYPVKEYSPKSLDVKPGGDPVTITVQ
jgi:hypothetical protein